MKWILGVEVIRDRSLKTLKLSQAQYVRTAVVRFEKELAEVSRVKADVPMTPGSYLSLKDCPEQNSSEAMEAAKLPCRELLGVLLWVCMTRPDIMFAVSNCCDFMDKPNRVMWRAALQILKYLSRTSNELLTYNGNAKTDMFGLLDIKSPRKESRGAWNSFKELLGFTLQILILHPVRIREGL